jgi:Zn-dependent metalloprotease
MANGLRTVAIHTNNAEDAAAFAPQAFESVTTDGAGLRTDPETAARSYLSHAFNAPTLGFAPEEPGAAGGEFRTLGSETVPLTNSQTVKFRQYIQKIPVYGSLVTVEMDENNQLLSINSALGEPSVNPVASISPLQALQRVQEEAGEEAEGIPRLHYYYDDRPDNNEWRLVYLIENVYDSKSEADRPHLYNFVVDAHTAEIVRQIPRSACVDAPEVETKFVETTVVDENGTPRAIAFRAVDASRNELHDERYNVHTYDFAFADAAFQRAQLPGQYVANPPEWAAPAVSAHANAGEVARYVTDVLRRNGLDNRGEGYISSINCTYRGSGREWRNAAWTGKQMIYGQRMENGVLKSYARALDVVAHEIFHGITDRTAGLEYLGESGALNESYSDIFGVLVSNRDVLDPRDWNWQLGEELGGGKGPLRDLGNPGKHGQPEKMSEYRNLPLTLAGDWGGVHINSGIHNRAAYLLLTARSSDGDPLFDPRTGGAVFYVALTQHLSRTSSFSDSRRAVTLAIQSLFRTDPLLQERLTAVANAFHATEIV